MTHSTDNALSQIRSSICQLPPNVVNQIAAGEVIERPASVVKELVENAIDAGATRIDVTVEKGGVDLIRVSDNGCGVAADELTLAMASHATSKIRDADDLFRVATLGFRGEALASIASVSRMTFRSRPADAESAAELETVGGRGEQVRPAGGPCGTVVEVRQLFFNTPVRKKFLRTTQTEMGHVTEAITRVSLAHPDIHFTLSHGARTLYDLPPSEGLPERVAALFGEQLASALIPVEALDDDLRVSGYVANPSHSRGSNRMQYVMLNGRFIRDRSLQHALGEAYRGLLLTGRYPVCFMSIEMPADMVDVNVHPTKLEVRFQDGGRVYSQLLSALRTKFLSTDLVARPNAPAGESAAGSDAVADDLVRWAQQQLRPPGTDAAPTFRPFAATPESESRGPLQLHPVPTPLGDGGRRFNPAPADLPAESELPPTLSNPPADEPTHGLQIHNRYLVVENEDGLEVIDQHALHERILYEVLRERVLAGDLESQKLLVPEPVDVAANEASAVLENRELLGRLGVDVEPFGGETILVSSYPAMLANLAPADVLRSLIEQLLSGGKEPEPRDVLDDLMHMIACKAAIKYGDRLEPQEINELLRQRKLVQDHHHCPAWQAHRPRLHPRSTRSAIPANLVAFLGRAMGRARCTASSPGLIDGASWITILRVRPAANLNAKQHCSDTLLQGRPYRLPSSAYRLPRMKSNSKICVCIGRSRHKHMMAEHRHMAEQGAQMVELRLDYVASRVNVRRLLVDRPEECEVIITARRQEDGGKWSSTEENRMLLLREAIAEGVDYIDLEEDIASKVPRYGKTKRIISYHNFRKTPENLRELHERMAGLDPDIIKIATTANSPHDCLRMLEMMQESEIPTVGMCMGDMGTPSRILAGKFNAPFTYATFHHERTLAPGQLSYKQMTETYRYERIGPETAVYGVIADPVGHSLSPHVHNAAFEEGQVDAVYLPFRVPADNLDQFIQDAPRLGIRGLSVTIPLIRKRSHAI